jgi:hypothetical protein
MNYTPGNSKPSYIRIIFCTHKGHCVILGFRHGVNEVSLLGCYAALISCGPFP